MVIFIFVVIRVYLIGNVFLRELVLFLIRPIMLCVSRRLFRLRMLVILL